MEKQIRARTGLWRVAKAVGRVTFSEIMRDRVLYNTGVIAVLLMSLGFLASRLTTNKQERVILDFGISAVAISCLAIAVFVGAGMIGKEFERRTIFVALSRPISRFEFVFGKFVGMLGVLFVNWFLISAIFLAVLWQTAGAGFPAYLSVTLVMSLVLALLQSIMMSALAIFFSSFSTTSVSVMLSLGIYLIGTNTSQMRLMALKSESPTSAWLLNGVATVLPSFEYFQLGNKVTYGLSVQPAYYIQATFYAVFFTTLCLILAGVFIQRREA